MKDVCSEADRLGRICSFSSPPSHHPHHDDVDVDDDDDDDDERMTLREELI